jgi:hypothetical protein
MDTRDGVFVLENYGDVASEVKIIRFEVAPNVSADAREIPTIGSSQEAEALVWVEGFPPSPLNMEKWDLPAAMKKAADARNGGRMYRPNYTISVTVRYRDIDNGVYFGTAELSYIPANGQLIFGPTNQKREPH